MAVLSSLLVRLGVDEDGVQVGVNNATGVINRGAKKMAAAATAAGVAAGVAMGAGVVQALNVDAGIDKLSAQLGAGATESKRLGAVAGELYANAYGANMDEVSAAIAGVIRNVEGLNSISNAELRDISATVLDLAKAFEADLGGVTRAVGKLLKTNLADTATEALDILTAGFVAGVDEAGDLLDTVSEYSTQFRKVGLSGQEMMGVLTQGLKAGARDADVVADAIKEFSIRAIDGSVLTAAGFDAIGLSAESMADKIAAGGPTSAAALDLTLDKLRAMEDPVARDAAAVALFGTQAEDLGQALFALDPSAAVGALGKVEGSAAAMGETLNDNAKTKLTAFARSVKVAFVDFLGGKALPFIEDTADFLNSSLGPAIEFVSDVFHNKLVPAGKAVIGFFREHSTTAKLLAGIITGILVTALIVWTTTMTIAATRAVGSWLAVQLATAGSVAKQVAKIAFLVAKWVFLGVQSLIQAAKVAAAWLIAMGPIGLVIAAVVALVALIIAKWDSIKNTTKKVWNAISGFLSGAWDKIKSVGAAAFNRLVDLLLAPIRFAKSQIESQITFVLGFFQNIPGKIGGFFGGLADTILGPFKSAFNAIADIWNSTVGELGFEVPGWVPGIGGKGWSVPDIPTFATGGRMLPGLAVAGETGLELIASEEGGRVFSPAMTRRIFGDRPGSDQGDDRPMVIELHADFGAGVRQVVEFVVSEKDRATHRRVVAGVAR